MRSFVRKILKGRSPAFAVLLTIVTQGMVVLLNTATGVLTARLLGPHGRGVFTAVTIWPQLLSVLGALGIPNAVVYFIRGHTRASAEIVGASYVLTGLSSGAMTLAGLITAPMVMRGASPDEILLAEFCILWTWTSMFTVVLRQIMVACDLFQAFSVSSYVPPLAYLIALLLAWPTIGIDPVVAACCLMLSGPLGLLWMTRAASGTVRWRVRGCGPWLPRIFGYAAKFAPADVSSGLLAYVDRLVLIPFLPASELGLYVVAYSLSRLMLVLQTAIGSVLYASMAGRDRDGAKHLHDIAFRLMFFAVAVVIVATYVVSRGALVLIYGDAYSGAADLLRILIVEAGVTCLGQVNVQLYLSLNRPGFPAMAQVASLAVAVVLLAALVPRHGAAGAAITLLVASAVRSTILLGGMPALLRMRLPSLIPGARDLAYVRARLH